MQITPITMSSIIGISQQRKIDDNLKLQKTVPNFEGSKKQTVSYPRRYLPEYYPILDSKTRTYDSFTGMRDKNYLLAVINSAMSSNGRQNQDLSIAMFDMDNFKSINELLGYKTGDNFIKAISSKISDAAKQNSINAYRFGGEEFVLVFANQSKKQQSDIVNRIIKSISQDEYIISKSSEYRKNAEAKLKEYQELHSKIETLIPLKTKYNLFQELRENLETEEAKNDPYLLNSINGVDEEIKGLYLSLISERLADDSEDAQTKAFLRGVRADILKDGKIPDEKEKDLDEYLISSYDKTFEIHQIKKWIHDFDQNGGFSMTGGVVNYSSDAMKDKTPLDLINGAGEILKQGKTIKKGQSYYTYIRQ